MEGSVFDPIEYAKKHNVIKPPEIFKVKAAEVVSHNSLSMNDHTKVGLYDDMDSKRASEEFCWLNQDKKIMVSGTFYDGHFKRFYACYPFGISANRSFMLQGYDKEKKEYDSIETLIQDYPQVSSSIFPFLLGKTQLQEDQKSFYEYFYCQNIHPGYTSKEQKDKDKDFLLKSMQRYPLLVGVYMDLIKEIDKAKLRKKKRPVKGKPRVYPKFSKITHFSFEVSHDKKPEQEKFTVLWSSNKKEKWITYCEITDCLKGYVPQAYIDKENDTIAIVYPLDEHHVMFLDANKNRTIYAVPALGEIHVSRGCFSVGKHIIFPEHVIEMSDGRITALDYDGKEYLSVGTAQGDAFVYHLETLEVIRARSLPGYESVRKVFYRPRWNDMFAMGMMSIIWDTDENPNPDLPYQDLYAHPLSFEICGDLLIVMQRDGSFSVRQIHVRENFANFQPIATYVSKAVHVPCYDAIYFARTEAYMLYPHGAVRHVQLQKRK